MNNSSHVLYVFSNFCPSVKILINARKLHEKLNKNGFNNGKQPGYIVCGQYIFSRQSDHLQIFFRILKSVDKISSSPIFAF